MRKVHARANGSICYRADMAHLSSGIGKRVTTLIAATVLVGGGFVMGRLSTPPGARDEQKVKAPAAAAPAAQPAPSVAPLGREDLVALAATATRAYAAGRSAAPENASLIGRRFEIAIPFGCAGPTPAASGEPLRWDYDAEAKALKLTARPEDWTDAPWVRSLAGAADAAGAGGIEAIEGFWIPRPWAEGEACPPRRDLADIPILLQGPERSLALAEFHSEGSSRVARRGGQPYETVTRLEPDQLPTLPGFRLVLQGRIDRLPNSQPSWCSSETAELRPRCVVAVKFDLVRFVNPATDETIAEWRS